MLLFNSRGKMVDVDLKNVDHIERDVRSRKTLFHVGSKIYHAAATVEEFGQAYQQYGFQKIDRNRLINLDRVSSRESGFLYIGSKKYTVTRRNELIIRKIMEHM